MSYNNAFKKCVQGYDPRGRELCDDGKACKNCGWNVDVINKRNRQINEEGLTLCSDGLRRLVIK